MRFGSDKPDRRDEPVIGVPRWVKVSAIIALVVLALFLIMLVSGHRGPGRHL